MQAELLSTTRLPLAVNFMLTELKHSGQLSSAFEKLAHYFTPLQTFVIACAEDDRSRLTFGQALLILEREAQYRASGPTRQGLFVYQLESLSRNRLGYAQGLLGMQHDAFYDEHWREYLALVRRQLGLRDFAELIFARSDHYVDLRRRHDPDYQPGFQPLFSAKEGQIAGANRGKDPMFLFATLQRQMSYPEVPRPPKVEKETRQIEELQQQIKILESRLSILEGEVRGDMDLSKFYVKKDEL